MKTSVAVMGILVEHTQAVEVLNALLHEYGDFIVGRMGIPYRARGLHVISIVMDAPRAVVDELAGRIGALDGVRVTTAASGGDRDE